METTAYTIYTTYQTKDIPVATLITPVSEFLKEDLEKFREQFNARKGPLYTNWLAERAKRLKQDIVTRRERKPEVVKL